MADAALDRKDAPAPRARGNPTVTFLMIVVSTFALALVGMLLATGAAQRSAYPRIRALFARAEKAAAPRDTTDAAAADSAAGGERAWSVAADSLAVLRDQIALAMDELGAAREGLVAEGESARAEESAAAGPDSSALRDFTRFVKVLESMKADEAADLLNGVDDAFAVEVVRRLKERQAAKVLTLLAPEKARAVTLALGRVARGAP